MGTQTIEERLAVLEAEVAHLKHGQELSSGKPWWEEIRGAFKDDPTYDEAMRYGREYRKSLRPDDHEDLQ